MIGRVVGAYCDGRRDARRDAKRKRHRGESDTARRIYLLGYYDELARMAEAGRLAQYTLELEAPQTETEGT